ncbi:MAG: N-acetylmuramidase domain-containing protein [Paludibacter sp.]|nr:N-acetylmuramidase domain-containing protein [Paludibacter sp.]
MTKNLLQIIKDTAVSFNQDWEPAAAFIEVESGGEGFDPKTGRILIQFEPAWFRKQAPYAPSGAWSVNKVDVQRQEWFAFNDAWNKDKEAALKSTSIGLGQIMGFHYKRLGYQTAGEMWDDAKKGLHRQVWQIFKFIETDARLQAALQKKDWATVATIYNGPKFRELAKKYGRVPYDISMKESYEKFKML